MSRGEVPLERARERLNPSASGSYDITQEERKILEELDHEISLRRGNRFSSRRHHSILSNVALDAERCDFLSDIVIEPDADGSTIEAANTAVEVYKKYLLSEFDNGWTLDTRISTLRVALELISEPQLIDKFDLLTIGHASDEEVTPDPGTILHYQEDVVPRIETFAPGESRNRAILATAYGSALRPESELHKLQFKHLNDVGDHIIITTMPHSKTGVRDVHMYVGSPYLRKWLNEHPAHDNGGFTPETPIWSYRDTTEQLSYSYFGRTIHEAGKAAQDGKPVAPKWYRKSRASYLAARMTSKDLEDVMGWVHGSTVARHYVARFGDQVERATAIADGADNADIINETDDTSIAPVECPSCGQYTPRHQSRCTWCPTEFDSDAADGGDEPAMVRSEEYKQVRQDLLSRLTNGDLNQADIETARDLMNAVKSHPDLLDHMDNLRSLLDDERTGFGESS